MENKARIARTVKTFLLVLLIIILSAGMAYTQTDETCDITTSVMETPHQEHTATQLPAEVGQPVQWVKQVSVQNLYDQAVSELTISVPDDAQNIVATDSRDNSPVAVTSSEGEVKITDSLEFNEQKSYVIKYETKAPEMQETSLTRKGDSLVKNVIVSSDYHYEDVATYTDIPETDKALAGENIRLYWQINGVKTDVTDDPEIDLRFYDTNNNGMYDRIGWITPHLSTQIFEIVIYSDANPGSFSAIGLNLMYPANGEYITSTSRVGFNYSVDYNSSTTVFCNLTVDGVVRRENTPTVADTEITTFFNLSSGTHSWNVNCAGSDGAANTSATRTFTIDLDTPTITLSVPDYYVSSTNSISLNFTPVDDKYPVMVCSLSINRALNRTGIIATNNTMQTTTLTSLPNGVYNWNVSCTDAAMNTGRSEERVFYISAGTPSAYNISSNKDSYAIGEVGYFIATATAGSNLTLFVETPTHDSFFRYYNGRTFPLIDNINFTNNAGTYNIDGIFTNGGNMYIVKTSFVATSSFVSEIEANDTTGEPGAVFHFESNATGGIGGVTYNWDFGDDTTTNGSKVDHTYPTAGDYIVELTATDSKGNKATDTKEINVHNIYDVQIILKELQTRKLLSDVPVELDDERKSTDLDGSVNFTVFEGKRRIYVALEGYEWVKQVRNITEDITIIIEMNNTAITNYTPIDEEAEKQASAQEADAKGSAEAMLAAVTAALETLDSSDQATEEVITALKVEEGLQQATKDIRQIIRDLGNAEVSTKLTAEEREARIKNITNDLERFRSLITGVTVDDTTEMSDYPKAADIAMLSTEYLRYKKINYSNSEKEDYLEQNTKLQAEAAITTRLSTVQLVKLSGDTTPGAVVINKITKKPSDTNSILIAEYLPKEVAGNAGEIKKVTEFETIKSDPILKFSPSLESYSYYIEKETSMDDLKKIKHVFLNEPAAAKGKGLGKVTGFSFLPKLNIENPKLFFEILVIIVLLLAYIVYHFELVDKYKDFRKRTAPYETDMAYNPVSTPDSFVQRAKDFIKKEDDLLIQELSHIKMLISSAHSHAESRQHEKAHETYEQIMEAYRGLSKEAKQKVHPETKHVYNKVLLAKANHLLDEAFSHVDRGDHKKAASHYTEIKNLYSQLEKEHRAAVSERCIRLHAKLFERSLT